MKHPRKHRASIALSGLAAMGVLVACGVGSRSSFAPSETTFAPGESTVSSPPPTLTPAGSAHSSPSPIPSDDPGDGCGTATLSIDYDPLSVASLAQYGWDFVVADIEGFGEAAFNTDDGEPPPGYVSASSSPHPNPSAQTLIYTPANVDVVRSLSGPVQPGAGQFLLAGGTVGCYTIRVSPSPQVEAGSRYVLVITDAMDSEGEHALPVQEATFAWPVSGAGMVVTVDGLMTIDELAGIVATSEPSHSPEATAAP
jgi:hypothetical protein